MNLSINGNYFMSKRHLYFKKPTLITYWLRQLFSSDNFVLMTLAVGVGFATALALSVFRGAIDLMHGVFVDTIGNNMLTGLGTLNMVVALALAGLLVGLIRTHLVGKERYHGVADIIEAVALAGGRLRYRVMPFKAFASSISLGAGSSVGPEDPGVQIGSNLGSLIGQRLHLDEEHTRLLVSAGAASAISAAFNAPIAGVFFALEVILHGELATASVSVVIISAVMSAGVTQGLGLGIISPMGPFDFALESVLEVPFFVPLGLFLAPFAALFIRQAYFQYDLWNRIPFAPPLRTALAGALVGLVGIAFPEIMGAGRDTMNDVLQGQLQFALLPLFGLALAKLIMTSISLGAGFVGGIFAPSLFIGTMLGELYGRILNGLMGSGVGDPRTYAIAGMAGMMAGVVRAPITAIMLVFELTSDYRLILPIMLVSVICIMVSERFEAHSVYEEGLVREGIILHHGRDVDVMQGVTVEEAMHAPAPRINRYATLTDLRDALQHHHRHALCVVDNNDRLVGIVTLSDLQRGYKQENHATLTVDAICSKDVLIAEPDDVLWQAIRAMGARGVGRLPVVDDRTGKLVGLVNRGDIVNAYNTAIHRKLHDQQQHEQIRLNTLTGAHVYELHIRPDSGLDGKTIAEVKWPPESVVASVQRRGKLIVPHGNTLLHKDDILMIVADPHSETHLVELFGKNSLIN